MTTFVKPVAEPETETKEPVPTWVSDFFLPLAQNVAAGAAVAAFCMMGVVAYTGAANTLVDFYNASVWCALVGGVPTCILTIVRFWGDELGLLQSAYHTGYTDAQAHLMPQIAKLQLELRASYDAQNEAELQGDTGVSSVMNRRMQKIHQARADAARIVEVAFDGDAITRAAMGKRGIGQRDWERAMRMLVAAGAMREDGAILAKTPAEAFKALDELLGELSKQPDSYRASWE